MLFISNVRNLINNNLLLINLICIQILFLAYLNYLKDFITIINL